MQHHVDVELEDVADGAWKRHRHGALVKVGFFGAGAPGRQVDDAGQLLVVVVLKRVTLVLQGVHHGLRKQPLAGKTGADLGKRETEGAHFGVRAFQADRRYLGVEFGHFLRHGQVNCQLAHGVNQPAGERGLLVAAQHARQ